MCKGATAKNGAVSACFLRRCFSKRTLITAHSQNFTKKTKKGLFLEHFTWKQYVKYIKSNEWKWKRRVLGRLRGYKCEICGVDCKESGWQVHHLTYERFGHEKFSDLMLVCPKCHRIMDAERKREAKWKHIRDTKGGNG